MNNSPLISVITVVFNDNDNIESTIRSVLNQTYNNIEYIIVDGKSVDGTIETIKKYSNKIEKIISEEDNGIYDAMNKGIAHTKGEWLYFLNSGDVLYNKNVLSNILDFLKKNEDPDIIYGDVFLDYGSNYKQRLKCNLQSIWKAKNINHQSMVFNKRLFKNRRFSLKYRLASDYEFILDSYINNKKFIYCNNIISIFQTGGLSDKNAVESIKEASEIVRKRNKSSSLRIYWFITFVMICFYDKLLKKFLPNFLLKRIHNFYRKVCNLNVFA